MSDRESFVAKYGDVTLRFTEYYKYTFTYTGTAEDGTVVSASVGGGADEIYRKTVRPDDHINLRETFAYAASATRDGKEVDSFYDY